MTNLPHNPIESAELADIIDKMIHDRDFRLSVVRDSHPWFFYYYFSNYIKFRMAPFHQEMFRLTEDQGIRTAVVVAFRGSAKSTIFTLSFPIWAILGKQQIKHVMILSSTQHKAQIILQNIKREFETNRALQMDLGPFREERNEWNTVSLYLPRHDAKITIASVEQSIRGARFKEHRPQLILIDDMEDMDSVKTLESRNKIDQWLMGEVIPAGDDTTRMFVVGNLLHQDSVVRRLQKKILDGTMHGTYFGVPLLDAEGRATWPGKYPDQAAIDVERGKGLSENAWRREFMLEIIPEEDQIIREEWLHYYDTLPPMEGYAGYRFAATGVDLAISEKETADYTAAVSVQVYGYGKDRKIYVLPNPLNKRLDAPKAVEEVKWISLGLGNGISTQVYVEDVGYQRAFIQFLKEKDILVEGVAVAGNDKRSRLSTVASLIQTGAIVFPKRGCEQLLMQILGFGVERHDDIVDAFTLVVLKLIASDNEGGRITFPGPYSAIVPAQTRDEQEKEADQGQILLAEAMRSGDNIAWQKYHAHQNEQRKKYWRAEERIVFNRIRRY